MAEEDEDADPGPSEAERWRRSQLIRLGFTHRQADRLCEQVDVVHDAERLVLPPNQGGRGCPVHIAFDILS